MARCAGHVRPANGATVLRCVREAWHRSASGVREHRNGDEYWTDDAHGAFYLNDPPAKIDPPIEHDPVNNPRHYTSHASGVECITITQHMNYCRGNAIKYIWRAGEKSDEVEDLRKARFYIDNEIQRLEAQRGAQ